MLLLLPFPAGPVLPFPAGPVPPFLAGPVLPLPADPVLPLGPTGPFSSGNKALLMQIIKAGSVMGSTFETNSCEKQHRG